MSGGRKEKGKEGEGRESKYTHMTPLQDKDLPNPDRSALIKKGWGRRGWGWERGDLLFSLLNVVERKLTFVEHLALSHHSTSLNNFIISSFR